MWASTGELAREYGLPEKPLRARVRDGSLTPTYRTPGGQARWRRDDFAAQIAPANAPPIPTRFPTGAALWEGSGWQVCARPSQPLTVQVGRRVLLMDSELARLLTVLLPAAAEVADARPPNCTCRELSRGGRVEMLVPTPGCPVHQGRTP